MASVARHALVSGRVQGVAFRHYTKVRARELGLTGWVRNLADGRVEVWIEGPDEAVRSMTAWLERGPPAAHVDEVRITPVESEGHAQFRVQV